MTLTLITRGAKKNVRLYDVISHDVINLPKTHYRMARLILINAVMYDITTTP